MSKNIPIPLTSKSDAQKCWSLDLEQVFIGSIEYYWHQGFSFFGWDGGTQDMGSHSPLPELSPPRLYFPRPSWTRSPPPLNFVALRVYWVSLNFFNDQLKENRPPCCR